MERRKATREEILNHYRHNRKVSFETYVREVSDPRTESGVRHIRSASSVLRDVDGIPTVRRLGEDFELFAEFFTLPSGQTFVACPTIIKQGD